MSVEAVQVKSDVAAPADPPADILRVASIPENHPYVRHLAHPAGPDGVRRLTDPRPDVPAPAPGQWWPPRMLEPEWIEANHDRVDLVHLHFGFDAADPPGLRRWIETLGAHHIPLVMTVHDLTNPHFVDSTAHRANLDELVPAAAELITLTDRAARQIERQWSRRATVIPHPHIVPFGRMIRPRRPHRGFVIGVHGKSLRANIDPLPIVSRLLPDLSTMPAATLRLDLHPDVMDQTNDDSRAVALRCWLSEHGNHPQLDLSVHPRFTDAQLWDYLQGIDVCVLPYRFGTHSGWLEACVDLGTEVLVPSVGCYSGQHGHPAFGPGTTGLAEAVRAAYVGRARTGRPDRRAQRHEIAVRHEAVYRQALSRVAGGDR